jgi:hypothetical protein
MLGWLTTIVLALTLSILQHGWLATWPVAPDLTLALMAWLIVDGSDRGVLVRAWLVGVSRDLIDPGSVYFHAIGYSALALAFLPVRSLVFHARGLTWAVTAFIASLVLSAVDRMLTGPGDGGYVVMIAIALMTGLCAPIFGGIFSRLPHMIHPAGKGMA